MSRKRSIGVVVVLDTPGQEKNAVLQLRDQADSFPGCAQLTVHGRVEGTESLGEALRRESREELYELFGRASRDVPAELERIVDTPPEPLHIEGRTRTPREQVASLSLRVHDPRLAELVRPLIEAGVLRAVTRDDLGSIVTVDPKSPEQRQHGVAHELIGMFADERLVLERVLGKRDEVPTQ